MSARSVVALGMALVGTWVVAGPADALEPGVFIDPGSPAGKEYSVPLSVLRGAASGGPGGGGQAQSLFGNGISPAGVSPHAGRAVTQGKGSRTTQVPPNRRNGPPVAAQGGKAPRTKRSAGAPRGGPVAAPTGGAAQGDSATLPDLTDHGSAVPAVGLIGALVVFGGLGFGALLVVARRRLG